MKTDSSEMSIDTAIYHAATILTAVTGEVVALSQLIFRQMDKQFSQNGIQCGRAFEQTTTGRAVRARWFHKPISFTEPNDVANGHLTLVFDFGVENGLSGKIKAPILFVCWYPGPLIKWETWEIGSFEGEELAKVHQSRNGIAGYGQTVNDLRGDGWVYAIKLSALADVDALERCVVQPVLGLLSSPPSYKALGDIRGDLLSLPTTA
jgi:hypothetical protein